MLFRSFWQVLVVGALGAILGDHIGYVVGRRGGRQAVDAIVRRTGRGNVLHRAEAFTARWGAPGIFFSRWLVTALGPWINLSSGVARFPYRRFLVWDVLGEGVWVAVYVTLGRLFSDRVADLADLLGNLGWLLVAVVVAIASGLALQHELRRALRRAHRQDHA